MESYAVEQVTEEKDEAEIQERAMTENYSHEWLFIGKALERVSLGVLIMIYLFSIFGFITPIWNTTYHE